MKPIELSFSGLQSYREKQTVDFGTLCEAGVFGIFGPTGSGKSTILDAMTLALYGKVERAVNGTQGIMNHAERSLSVSFTFELSNGQQTEMYRVERQYKRTNDVSIQNALSRLIQLFPQGDTVLADKQGDVNKSIEELIGLSMQDFTRAVVLPQGKFAEFLSLKGSERRQMLQRLFHLEHYGDQLQLKVNSRAKVTDLQIKQLEAEQLGLGQASKEDVEAARVILQAAAEAAERKKKTLKLLEEEVEKNRQVLERQRELQELQHTYAELQRESAVISELEAKLQELQQAERLEPYLRQLEAAKLQAQKAEHALKDAKTAYDQMRERLTEHLEAHRKASLHLAEQEEPTRALIEQYKQAIELEKQYLDLHEQAEQAKQAWEQAEHELKSMEAQLTKDKQTLAKAAQKQEALQQELRSVEVKHEERQVIQKAAEIKRAVDALDKQSERLEAELQSKQQESEVMEQELAELEAASRSIEAQMREVWLQCGHLQTNLKQAAHQCTALEQHAMTLEAAAKAKAKQQEFERMAAILRSQLKDNEECLVCGSHVHRLEAHSVQVNDSQSIKEGSLEEQLYEAMKKVQSIAYKIREGLLLIDARFEQVSALEVQWAYDEVAVSLESSELEFGLLEDDLMAGVIQLQSSIVQMEEAVQTVFDAIEPRTIGLKQTCELYHQQQKLIQEKKIQHRTLQPAVLQLMNQLKALKQEKDLLISQYNAQYAELALDQVDQALEQLTQRDQLTDELRTRLERSVPFIQQVEAHIETLNARCLELERHRFEWKTKADRDAEQCAALKHELYHRVGEGSPNELYQRTLQQFNEWKQTEQQLGRRLDETRVKNEEALKQFSAAEQAHQSAEERLNINEQQWNELFSLSGFETIETLKEGIASLPQRSEWEIRVKQYRDHEQRLKHRIEELTGWLKGRLVHEEAWQELCSRLETEKSALELALGERAKAERDMQDITERHERWTSLQHHIAAKQALHRRLSQLQSVFRGNAFVEFLAEEQLMQVSRSASHRLAQLTRQRYAIEVDSAGGFIIRDDANGGVKRPVSTLSGGETFLTSLALALALSTEIQLRGKYPLQFFFLDEGFGTLDQELLDMVVTSLERLHMDCLSVGVISHVPELRSRLPRKLIVSAAEPSGRGSRISTERL